MSRGVLCDYNQTAVQFNTFELDDLPLAALSALDHGQWHRLPKIFQMAFIKALGPGSEPIFGLDLRNSRPFDRHLRDAYPTTDIIRWRLISRKDLEGFVTAPPSAGLISPLIDVEYLSKSGDPYLVGDFNAPSPEGYFDVAITCFQRDLIWITSELCLRGPPYYWPKQYISELSPDNRHRLVYDCPMPDLNPLMPIPEKKLINVGDFIFYKLKDSIQHCCLTGIPRQRVWPNTAKMDSINGFDKGKLDWQSTVHGWQVSDAMLLEDRKRPRTFFGEGIFVPTRIDATRNDLPVGLGESNGESNSHPPPHVYALIPQRWHDHHKIQPHEITKGQVYWPGQELGMKRRFKWDCFPRSERPLFNVGPNSASAEDVQLQGADQTQDSAMCGDSNVVVKVGMGIQIGSDVFRQYYTVGDELPSHGFCYVSTIDHVKKVLWVTLLWSSDMGPEGILKMNPGELCQTDLCAEVPFKEVQAVFPLWPGALWNQYCGGSGQFGQIVVAHLEFRVPLPDGLKNGFKKLLEWKRGSLTPVPTLVRVRPLKAKELFEVLCTAEKIIADGVPVPDCCLEQLRSDLIRFAMGKAKHSKTSAADHSFSVSFDGRKLMRLLHQNVDHSKLTVKVSSGLLQVSVSEFDALQPLFNRKVNEFCFLDKGFGFVHLDPPMIFKWQMYDESDGDGMRKTFLHSEGRAAVTVGSYAATDRMGVVIKTTRPNPDSKKQLSRAPLDCAVVP